MDQEEKCFPAQRASSSDRKKGCLDKLQEVGLLLLWLFSTLRVVCWCLSVREMFGCILNQGKLPYFDHTHYLDFRTGFWVGNKWNLVVSPSGKL